MSITNFTNEIECLKLNDSIFSNIWIQTIFPFEHSSQLESLKCDKSLSVPIRFSAIKNKDRN